MAKPDVYKPTPKDTQDFDRLLSRYKALTDLQNETEIWRDGIELHVDTNGAPYFAMVPLSDMHIGHRGVDIEALTDYINYLRNYPIHTILVGDLGDFFSPTAHADGMLQDVLTPDDQLLLLRRFMQEFQEKILASVQDPSHTDWIRSRAGIEPHRWMTEDLDIPLLKSGSVMNLTVNDQRYKILLFHAIARFGYCNIWT